MISDDVVRKSIKRQRKVMITSWLILFLIVMVLIPIGVNYLMSFKVVKVYGDNNAWIGFLGTYIGSLLSGVFTFGGVLLTIKFTREFTREESRRDKLPEKIDNMEQCLDYIEDVIMIEIQMLKGRSFEGRTFNAFEIDDNYGLYFTEPVKDLLKKHLRATRNYIVKADTDAYEYHVSFVKNLDNLARSYVEPLHEKLEAFQREIIRKYEESHDMIIYSDNGKLTEIDLSEEDEEIIDDIRLEVYETDVAFVDMIEGMFNEYHEGLKSTYGDLAREFIA